MTCTDQALETAIVELLRKKGSCAMDELTDQLPEYGWNPIFVTLDQLSRDGRVVLRRFPKSGYQVSLPSTNNRRRSPEKAAQP
ncbi:hypothetical protein [Petrachloros mirabilis]